MTETPGRDPATPPAGPTATPPTEPTATQPTDPAQPPTHGGATKDPLRSSRTGNAWIGVVALCVVLLLLIIFIAQNTQSVQVSFLGWDGHPPLAVALLIAAAAGLFLAAVAGSLRIWQLRRRVRRERKSRVPAGG